MDSFGKGNTVQLFGLGLIALAVIGFFIFMVPSTTPQATVPVAPAPAGTGVALACQGKASIVEDTTVYFDVKDRVNGTVQPDVNATPEINARQRAVISNINAGGNFLASPGDGYIIHLREDTSVDTRDGDYYYEVVRGNIPCEGTFTVQQTVGEEGGVNITVFNPDGTVNSTGGTRAMTTGESATFKVRLDGNTNDTYWGNPSSQNPLGVLIVFDTNNDGVELVEPAGVPFTTEGVPKNYSVLHAADTLTFAYQLTGVKSLKEFDSYEFSVRVQAQAAGQPGVGNDDVNFTVYDPTAFPDDTTGGFTWGWIDTDGAGTNIGATNKTGSIIVE